MRLTYAARGATAALAGLVLAAWARVASAAPLFAEEATTSGGVRWTALWWTIGVVVLTLLLLTVGYVYRMAAGDDRPPPVTILKPGEKITSD